MENETPEVVSPTAPPQEKEKDMKIVIDGVDAESVKVVKRMTKKEAKRRRTRKRTKRISGPAMKNFKFKIERIRGKCDVLGCNKKPGNPIAMRCAKHQKEVRTAQLKANNIVWRKRVKKGTAGHHVVYTVPNTKTRLATYWAAKKASQALQLVKSERASVNEEEFAEALKAREATPAPEKSTKKPAKKPTKKTPTKKKAGAKGKKKLVEVTILTSAA